MIGDDNNPLLSMLVYTGDLGLDSGAAAVDLRARQVQPDQVKGNDGKPFRLDMQPGQTVQLPDGLGSVTFEGVEPWVRIQISQTPGKEVALGGVVLALIGLLGSLFIRPRRVWVRARREGEGHNGRGRRAGPVRQRRDGGVLDDLVAELRRTEKA